MACLRLPDSRDGNNYKGTAKIRCAVSSAPSHFARWFFYSLFLLSRSLEQATRKRKFIVTQSFCLICVCFILIVRLFGTGHTDKLQLLDFLEAVGNLRFRGTSVLFRLPVSIIKLAQDEIYESLTGDDKSR